MEKYIGRLAMCHGKKVEVVGYGKKVEVVGYRADNDSAALLIVDASKIMAWSWDYLGAEDVVFKRCEAYCYASVNDLID